MSGDEWLISGLLMYIAANLVGLLPLAFGFNVISITLAVVGSILLMCGFCYAIGKAMNSN